MSIQCTRGQLGAVFDAHGVAAVGKRLDGDDRADDLLLDASVEELGGRLHRLLDGDPARDPLGLGPLGGHVVDRRDDSAHGPRIIRDWWR